MHKLVCVVGRSGSGKDTLVNIIAQKYNLSVLKSYTTRPKRDGEADTHIFIEESDFIKYQNDVVAYTEINGYKYFCTQQQLMAADIYIIDPNGITYFKNKYNFISIDIFVPENLRRLRAIGVRKDDAEVFESRNQNENQQFSDFEDNQLFDYQITNIDLAQSINEFTNILLKEHII